MNSGFADVVKACGIVVSALMVACSGAAQRPATVAAAQPAKVCQGDAVYGNAALQRVAGCAEIEGDLLISGVTSLAPLAGLTQIQGTLTIEDSPKLKDLAGLEGLSRVGALVLSRTGVFKTDGLEGVREVGQLTISDNPRLISIASLNKVRQVAQVEITSNSRLSAQYGLLNGLEHKPSRVLLEGNRGLSETESAALSQVRLVAAK